MCNTFIYLKVMADESPKGGRFIESKDGKDEKGSIVPYLYVKNA